MQMCAKYEDTIVARHGFCKIGKDDKLMKKSFQKAESVVQLSGWHFSVDQKSLRLRFARIFADLTSFRKT